MSSDFNYNFGFVVEEIFELGIFLQSLKFEPCSRAFCKSVLFIAVFSNGVFVRAYKVRQLVYSCQSALFIAVFSNFVFVKAHKVR